MQVTAAKRNLGVWRERSLWSHLAIRNHTSGGSAKGIRVSMHLPVGCSVLSGEKSGRHWSEPGKILSLCSLKEQRKDTVVFSGSCYVTLP